MPDCANATLKAIIRGIMSFIDSSGFKSYDGLVEVEYNKSAIASIMAKTYLTELQFGYMAYGAISLKKL